MADFTHCTAQHDVLLNTLNIKECQAAACFSLIVQQLQQSGARVNMGRGLFAVRPADSHSNVLRGMHDSVGGLGGRAACDPNGVRNHGTTPSVLCDRPLTLHPRVDPYPQSYAVFLVEI
jgi:hypothetical protein